MVQEYTQADNSCFGFGALPPELEIQEIPSPIPERNLAVDIWLSSHTELLILVDIRMSNGVHIS